MRRCKTAFCLMLIVYMLLIDASFGADVAKIGVVNFQKILDTSSFGKSARAEITKKGRQMEADLQNKGAEIEKQKKQFEQEALVMKKEVRDQRERDLRISINDLKMLQKKYTKDIKEFEARLVERIQKEVFDVIDQIGKKEGYLLIVEKRESGVLYAPNKIDITDQVIQEYNSQFAKTRNKDIKKPKR